MASLERDPKSGCHRIWFRFRRVEYKQSLKTTDSREAGAVICRVEETLRLLQRGRLTIPVGANPGTFILSDGTANGKPEKPGIGALRELFQAYETKLPSEAKEATGFRVALDVQ